MTLGMTEEEIHDVKVFRNESRSFFPIMLFIVKGEMGILITMIRYLLYLIPGSRESCEGPPFRAPQIRP